MHEKVEIDLGPEHLRALQTIVDPVLVSELPTVLWSPHGHAEAVDAVCPLIDVMLLDSDDLDDPVDAFARAERLRKHVYMVDLAWLRTTPWRERLAATFDLPERLAALREIDGAGDPPPGGVDGQRAAARRLAGLPAALGAQPSAAVGRTAGVRGGRRRRRGDRLAAHRRAGGARAGRRHRVHGGRDRRCRCSAAWAGSTPTERDADGDERQWKILGASRGEGGILGEGIRQALLREPTYCAGAERRPGALSRHDGLVRDRRGPRAGLRRADGRRRHRRRATSCSPAARRRRPPTSCSWTRCNGSDIDLVASTFWIGDERCVDPDDDRSNYKMIKESPARPARRPGDPHVHADQGRARSRGGRRGLRARCCETPGRRTSTCCCSGSAPTATPRRCFPGQQSLNERRGWWSACPRRAWSRSCPGSR